MSKKFGTLLVTGFLMVGACLAMDDDPPGRVARISFLNGTVSLQPGGVEDWVAAELNRPITTGDRLWTEEGARAELQLGSAVVRLSAGTNSSFINLDDRTTQVELSVGTMSVHLRDLREGEAFEIDTPHVAFSLLRAGDYRVEVSGQGNSTLVSVRGGEGELTAGGDARTVHALETLRISGDVPPGIDKDTTPPDDPFDQWCSEREHRTENSFSSRYVSRNMPGSEDLDNNGIWRNVTGYGSMWMPTGVPEGWAPYRTGRWAWIDPWGWTWIDDAHWGFAPFHYGRWVHVHGSWGWTPGPAGESPMYSPAMVAFMGGTDLLTGDGPGVAWVALGQGDVWVPPYAASERYFTRINQRNTVVNNVQITNVYRNSYVNKSASGVRSVNQSVDGAVTAVPRSVMSSGRSVAPSAVRVSPGMAPQMQRVQAPPVAPQHEAVLGGAMKTNALPPSSAMNRTLITKATPPQPRASFAQQQSALQANPGRPLDRSHRDSLQPAHTPTYQSAAPHSGPSGGPPTRSGSGAVGALGRLPNTGSGTHTTPSVQSQPQSRIGAGTDSPARQLPATNTPPPGQPPVQRSSPPPAQAAPAPRKSPPAQTPVVTPPPRVTVPKIGK
jgi:hypothetical protein